MGLVADEAREAVDDLGVGDVLLLRGERELQVVAHQPGDEARVVARQALFEAEGLGIHRAELRVVAAATLGDVVEQRRQIGDLRPRQGLHDLRELRQLVVEARQRETAQVAHHEQRVRVDRVGVEQVVLHAADDAAEGGDVAAEHAVVVHAAQLVGDAGGRAQDLEEEAMVARVLAELLVDEPEVLDDGAYGAGAHAADLGVLLQQREHLEQRRGLAHEQVVVHRFEVAVDHLEARVERLRHRRAGAAVDDGLAEQLQQQLVEQAHIHHGAVVALHQLLHRERERGVLVAEGARELDLVVEQQAVLAAAVDRVQRVTHPPQEALRGLETAQFARRQEPLGRELGEALGAEVALGDPGDGLDVAQPAGAGLHVRLEVVGGVVGLGVAVGLLAHLGLEEFLDRPQMRRRERLEHRGGERRGAGDAARLDQRGHHADIGGGRGRAFLDRAHAVPDLDADVPEEGDEGFERGAAGLVERRRDEDEDVDIGAGVQFAAAVAADRDQRPVGVVPHELRAPGFDERDIDELRACEHQRLDRLLGAEARVELGLRLAQGRGVGRRGGAGRGEPLR